jgi:hypothetical protein
VNPPLIARLVSGGQSGSDRAGLDVAIDAGLEYGGWCPRGGWAEDYAVTPGLLRDYPGLRETTSSDPAVRTLLNVRDSHATLIVRADSTPSPGTDLTSKAVRSLGRPSLLATGDPQQARSWLEELDGVGRALTLNVAGPRESEQPGVYALTKKLLEQLVLAGHPPSADPG